MRKHVSAAAAAALMAGCSTSSTWRPVDTAREAVWMGVTLIDYGQTLNIASHPERWEEKNPILGKHPSRSQVNAYFAASALFHPAVSAVLPTDACVGPICDWRAAWQWMTISVEAGVVGHNYSLGVKTDF